MVLEVMILSFQGLILRVNGRREEMMTADLPRLKIGRGYSGTEWREKSGFSIRCFK
jgi:hypothetical protein